MSEVRLMVREEGRDWSGTIHGSFADRAIAALSADPVTLDELEAAAARFHKTRPNSTFFSNLSPGSCDQPYDAGLVIIDLAARLVVVDSCYSSPGPTGHVYYHNGQCCSNTRLQYHLADDWLFIRDRDEPWEATAAVRRRKRAAKPPLDARGVFYGSPLLEFLARETFSAFARRDALAAEARTKSIENARRRLARLDDISPEEVDPSRLTDDEITPGSCSGDERYSSAFYDALKEIHAAWMLTPREDLDGATPRETAMHRRRHLGLDLQDRCQHWSFLGQCPPGLDESSFAYRYAGFGTHELVMYYDLVRELLWTCWAQLTELSRAPEGSPHRLDSLTVGDFLMAEIPRLERHRDAWLATPDSEHHGRTPRSIIDRERARLPEAVSGSEAMIDADCPCCQAMADMSGPTFWHLDGSAMDDDFAFDIYHETREEWEQEQRDWDERNRRFDLEWKERKRLGVAHFGAPAEGEGAVWSSSFSVGDTADVPLGLRVFGVGELLAELIVKLREGNNPGTPDASPLDSEEARRMIEQLHRDFGNLRELLRTTEPSLAETLIEPVSERFADTLASVAAARSDLTPRCESLTQKLSRLLDPPPPKPKWNADDLEVPF